MSLTHLFRTALCEIMNSAAKNINPKPQSFILNVLATSRYQCIINVMNPLRIAIRCF